MANIDIVIRDSGTPVVVRNLQLIANEARNAHQSISALNATLRSLASSSNLTASLTRSLNALGAQITSTTAQAQRLQQILNTMSTRGLPATTSAVNSTSAGFMGLGRALQFVAIYMSAGKIMEYADAWNSMAGLVRTSTTSVAEASAVTQKLYEAAQNTRAPLNEMADLYTATARAGKELGKSQNEVLQFTEGVGKALAVQHISANQAKGALIQLGQAISMGKVRSQEYNSLLQNGQVILQTVSRGMGDAGGSIAALTAKVKGAGVTSREFFEAFIKGSPELNKQFLETSYTFGQAFVVMKNTMAKYFGDLDHAYNLSGKFVGMVKWIGQNLTTLAGIFLGLGTAIALAFAPGYLIAFMAQLKALSVLIATNPILTLGAVIAGIAVAIYTMRNELKIGGDDITTLGHLLTVWGNDLKELFFNITGFIGSIFEDLEVWYKYFFGESDKYLEQHSATFTNTFSDLFGTATSSLENFISFFAVGFDVIGTAVATVAIFITKVWDQMTTKLIDLWENTDTRLMNGMKKVGNLFIDLSNLMTPGGLQIPKFELEPVANMPKIKTLGQLAGEAFQEGMLGLEGGGPAETYVHNIFDQARKLAASQKPLEEANLDTTSPPGDVANKVDKKEENRLKRLAEAYANVIAEINPMERALKRIADAQVVLNDAQKEGWITAQENVDIINKLKEKYAEALDPLKFLNEQMQREREYMEMTNDEAEIAISLYNIIDKLRRAGVPITDKIIEQKRQELELDQQLARIAGYRRDIEDNSTATQARDFSEQATAMQQKIQEMTATDQVNALENLVPWADFEGTQLKMDSYVEQHRIMFDQIKELRDKGLISEDTANNMRLQADLKFNTQRYSGMKSMFDAMSGLASSSNKKLAMIGKAGAIASATMDGYVAVMKAYTSTPYPYSIPAAVAVGLVSAQNIAGIISTPLPGYRTGGNFTVGGSGGDDSQTVAFRATPGEQVSINTPTQARALEKGGGNNQPIDASVTVLNVTDPKSYVDGIDNSAGKRVVMNFMQSDPAGFKRALGMN